MQFFFFSLINTRDKKSGYLTLSFLVLNINIFLFLMCLLVIRKYKILNCWTNPLKLIISARGREGEMGRTDINVRLSD